MSAVIQTQDLVGTWRRFGRAGPVYEVIGFGKPKDGIQTMRIRVIESGEETDYKLADLLADPLEA
jgi:hypothetical protein